MTTVRALTPAVLEVDLAMLDPPALAFEAGQWVSVPFGPKTVRAYSIASTPASPAALTLCADVAPAGPGSRWFRGLTPGDEVAFKGPLGGFVFDRADRRRPLFVAEEVGIVPIRSILTDLAETGFDRPATLVYCGRDPSWLLHDAELRERARGTPGFAYHPVVATASGARPESAAARLVDQLVTGASDVVAYVAGGQATIDRVREVLMAKGLERRAVKWERFW
ncbi:MAG TPA: FAD-dependent oxidoreductase [Methylomirabilota bacterium]|nr:FAD-dependent oxidoreductase [Methylomirabilota bacterium]